MKKLACLILTLCMFLAIVPFSAQAGECPTREIDGKFYYEVTDKDFFYRAVQLAFSQLTENLPACYILEQRNWDSSYSNDSRNFTGIQTKSVFTYAGYAPNTVCMTENYSVQQPDGTTLCYGTIDITYSDSKEELAKADAIIDGVLAKTAGYPLTDKMLYIADYICAATEYGFQEMPGGGYDLINGVYELLTGVRTNIVCTSYALTFQRFMEKAGVPCYILSNNYHAWNIVQVDGQWYGVDCTSDNGTTIDRPHFLMGSDTMRQYSTAELDPVGDFGKNHTIAKQDYGKETTTTTTTTTTTQKPSVATKPVASTTKGEVGSTAAVPSATSKPLQSVTTTAEATRNSTKTTATTVLDAVQTTQAASDTTTSEQDTKTTTAPAPTQQGNHLQVAVTEEPVDLGDYFEQDCDSVTITGEDFAWHFEAADVDTAAAAPLDVTITLGEKVSPQVQQVAKQAAQEVVKDKEIYPFTFAHHGVLPGKAEITITVDTAFAGKTVGVYCLDDNGAAKLEDTASVDADGRLTFATDHCSVWFVAEQVVDFPTAPNGMSVWIWIAVAAVVLAAVVVVIVVVRKHRIAR